MRFYISKIGTLAVSVLLLAMASWGTESRPVPPFQVSDLSGQTITSDKLCPSGSCLLIYLDPTSAISDSLLNIFPKDQKPEITQKIMVIVAGTKDDAQHLIDNHQVLQKAGWYTDQNKTVPPILQMKGAPVVFGVRDAQIQWSFSGIHSDPATLKSILTTWISQ